MLNEAQWLTHQSGKGLKLSPEALYYPSLRVNLVWEHEIENDGLDL